MKKTMNKYFWMMLALGLSLSFTSCYYDEDEHIGNYVSGRWFGDLGMQIDGIEAYGSEIQFTPTGWGYTHGYGYEIDYYHRGTIRHNFNWEVRNSILYLTFDNPDLDCAISDYRLTYDYFTGYMDGIYDSYKFTLRNYDRYWNQYGYGGYDYYYDPYYYVKGEKFGNDSTGTNVTASEPKCIRGVNMKKALENKE